MGKPKTVHTGHNSGTLMFSRNCIWMSIGVLFVMLGLCLPSQAQVPRNYTYNPNHFDAVKTIEAMQSPHPDLVIVSAHRGLHTVPGDPTNVPGVPENSLASVAAAARAGLEVLELDAKQTSDGQLTFSHDKVWGRQAMPVGGGSSFDPFSPVPPGDALNPVVADTPLESLQANWVLRDSVSFLYPSNPEPPPTLEDVINFYNANQIQTVLAFDIKDVPTFHLVWNQIKAATDFLGRPFRQDVVFKISGNLYPTPQDFHNDFGLDAPYINMIWVYNTSDIDPSKYGSEQAIINSLASFYADRTLSTITGEITQKQPGGILDTMRADNIAAGRSVAEFSATGDYFFPNNPTAQFYSSADGSCCQTLNLFYYTFPGGTPADTADDRGDLNFVLREKFNMITADTAQSWASQLASKGFRNLSYIQDAGFPGQPNCNAGTAYPGCNDANNPGTTVYTFCATEGGTCSFTGARNVAFGANGNYNYFFVLNSAACDDATFGPDPALGVVKGCYYGPASTAGAVYCADEGGTCSNSALSSGWFGAGHDYGGHLFSPLTSFQCVNSYTYFGADPVPGYYKTCSYTIPGTNSDAPAGYVGCAAENQICTFAGAARIAFGANGAFSYRTFTTSSSESAAGGVGCNVSNFPDPLFGVVKSCYYQYATPVGAVINPPGGTTPSGTSSTCDLYASGGTPCVAAHSMVRALFGGYSGRLYQVTRASDGSSSDIGTLSKGGYANAAAQDSFCAGTSCTITMIYDQTSNHNDLPVTKGDSLAVANALPVTVNGNEAYGLKVTPGVGYRNNATRGVATNGSPEGMYMVTSGTFVNNACCFDYGNAEPSATDTGAGHMDAINFGTYCEYQPCSGFGPWVEADLENGQYMGNGNNTGDVSMGYDFVTALKGGDAQSGGLTTDYSGTLPTGHQPSYLPMHQEGAIILGTGGDNSDRGQGSFFEGAMTSGYPTNATEDAVQANIVAAGYAGDSSGGSGGSGGLGVNEPAGPYTGPSDPGGPGPQDGFASPAAIQPNDVMATKPALASFNGNLYVAFQGVNVNNDLYVTSSPSGNNFPMATQYTNLQSTSAPALATYNNQLFMAFRGLNVDNDFYITSSPTGSNFPTATRYMNIQMGGAPALAVFNNQLYAAFQANDAGHTLHITSSSDGVTWPTAWQITNVAIGSDPAMAAFNGMLYVAFRANDQSNDVWIASSPDGINFSSQVLTGQTMDGYSSPALVASNGVLYYIYEANDQGHEMLVTASTDGVTWQGPAAYLGLQMGKLGPGAAAFANGVFAGFQSNDSRNVLFVTNKVTEASSYTGPTDGGSGGLQDGFTAPAAQQPNDVMGTKPALAAFHGSVYAAFEGVSVNNDLYVTSSPTGSNFPMATQYTNLRSSSAPALAQFNNQLFMAFRGLGVDNDLYVTSSPTGSNFPTATRHTNIQLGGAPAMALFNNKLYIAFQANDAGHTLHVTSSSDGVAWPAAWQVPNVRIGSDPAMTVFDGLLYIAFRADDPSNDVWIASSSDGINFTSQKLAGQTMAWGSSPALAVVNQNDGNYLYYVYEANDSSHEMLVSTTTDGSNWQSPALYSNIHMGATGPAATGFGNTTYVGFQSNDARNVLFVTNQPVSGNTTSAGLYVPNSTFYPRMVQLSHGASATNGHIVASTDGNIFVNPMNGTGFTFTGTVPSQYGYHLGSGTLYELPQTVGSLQAGTLLYAATYYYGSTRNTAIEVNTSTDGGQTWNYSSMPVSGAGYVGHGFWEPQFTVANDGALVMFWSDETDSCCSQKLSQIRTYNGTTWQDRSNTVASGIQADRPGMAVVTKLPSGVYFMSYELCGPASCTAVSRTSTDGWNFGDPGNTGTKIQTASGQYFQHAPTNVWSPSVLGINGALLLIGQQLFDSTGVVDPNSGSQMFVNLSSDGSGTWYTIAAPGKVPNPPDNYCPNYSTALLPLNNGGTIAELSSSYNDKGQCVSFLSSETWNNLPKDGTYYSLQNQHSNLCLGGGTTSSSPAVQTTCTDSNGVLDQYWQLHSQGRGWFTLESNKSLCLDNAGGSNTPGNKVVVWTCTGNNTNQNWQFRDLGNGQFFTVWNQAGQLPLDDTGGSTTPGNQLEIWIDNSLDAERWVLQ
jgi:hypothetical protein